MVLNDILYLLILILNEYIVLKYCYQEAFSTHQMQYSLLVSSYHENQLIKREVYGPFQVSCLLLQHKSNQNYRLPTSVSQGVETLQGLLFFTAARQNSLCPF